MTVLERTSIERDTFAVAELWSIVDAYRLTAYWGFSAQAFLAMIRVGVPPEALVDYAESRRTAEGCSDSLTPAWRHLGLTLRQAIMTASVRPDSSMLPRIRALGWGCPTLQVAVSAYETGLRYQARWEGLPLDQATYEMASHADSFILPQESGSSSHPYFGPQVPGSVAVGRTPTQAAEALAALAAREPVAVYAGIDRWAGERVARLTPWQRERYSTYEGVPLREAIRTAILDFAGLPDQGL